MNDGSRNSEEVEEELTRAFTGDSQLPGYLANK